jgi:DNA-directed RNA polymerase specialized sigma24 family protein
MMNHRRAVLDAIDEVYNLAYWMTGNEATAGLLVSQTYQSITEHSTMLSLYQSFRNCYLKSFGQTPIAIDDEGLIADGDIARAVIALPSDFKMAILFADIAELPHRDIASIVEKPVETVREWIHWGRKLLSKELASAYQN